MVRISGRIPDIETIGIPVIRLIFNLPDIRRWSDTRPDTGHPSLEIRQISGIQPKKYLTQPYLLKTFIFFRRLKNVNRCLFFIWFRPSFVSIIANLIISILVSNFELLFFNSSGVEGLFQRHKINTSQVWALVSSWLTKLVLNLIILYPRKAVFNHTMR